jgi:hypothetical protein
MRWWCSHKWVTISVSHRETGYLKSGRIEGYDAVMKYLAITEKLVKGWTHVVQQCASCGRLKGYELTGIYRLPQSANAERQQPANDGREEHQQQEKEEKEKEKPEDQT